MQQYLSLVKFSHTIFAMPFALLGFFLAIHQPDYNFNWQLLGLVVLCMVFARSAAMAFNRYLDRDIDKQNPRTAKREIPAGLITPNAALLFTLANVLLFITTTWFINPICFFLSPIAILVVLGYSYTKRFTALCHFVLGLGLALAPIGAYLAVTGKFALIPVLYSFIVLLWVAGFDIIYALQDEDFDKQQGLNSIPTLLGKPNALKLSSILHILCASLLLLAGYFLQTNYPSLQWLHWVAALLFVGLLVYQHLIVRPNDLSRVNQAFFLSNGIASLLFSSLVILDFYF